MIQTLKIWFYSFPASDLFNITIFKYSLVKQVAQLNKRNYN